MGEKIYDALVIGAGINGLAAAYHLQRLGCRRLGLIERFALGHARGSSHGQSRIVRNAYDTPGYVRLMALARRQEWPRLERDMGGQLLYPTSGFFMASGAEKYADYARAAAEAGANIEILSPQEAGPRFPHFDFSDISEVLHDREAALVAAARAREALGRWCGACGVEVLPSAQVLHLDIDSAPLRVETEVGAFSGERLVVAAGPWAPALIPSLRSRLKVMRQSVGYFELEGEGSAYRLGRFPVWGYLGEDTYYGLPEFGREGIKVARHITAGREDDPEEEATPEENEIAVLRRFVEEHFKAPIERLAGTESCLYTVTPNEDFIIDVHPDNERVAIAAGFSGHGFKFGPLVGRALAELVLEGRTQMAEFEAMRPVFALRQQ